MGLAKCFLMLINSIFIMVSLAFMAIGVILAFMPGKLLNEIYDKVKDSYPNNAPYNIPDSADDIADVPFVKTLGLALLGFGIFLFLLSMLIYLGTCCTSCCSCLLVLYAIIVVNFILAEIVLGCLFFINDTPLHDKARSQLKTMITDDYDDDGDDAFSLSFNLFMQNFDCCGVEGVQDFGTKDHRACDAGAENTGCYDKIQDEVEKNIIWCGVGLALLCLLQVIQVFCAITVYKDNKIHPF